MVAGIILTAFSCSQQSGTTRLVVDTGSAPGVSLSTNGSMPENVASLQLIVLDQDNVAAMESLAGDDENMTMEDIAALFLAYRNFGRNEAVAVDIDTGKNVIVGLSALDANGQELYFGYAENITVSGAEMNIPIVMKFDVPGVVLTTDSSGALGLTWPAYTGATSYSVKYSLNNDFATATEVKEITGTSTISHTITDLSGYTSYYVWVGVDLTGLMDYQYGLITPNP